MGWSEKALASFSDRGDDAADAAVAALERAEAEAAAQLASNKPPGPGGGGGASATSRPLKALPTLEKQIDKVFKLVNWERNNDPASIVEPFCSHLFTAPLSETASQRALLAAVCNLPRIFPQSLVSKSALIRTAALCALLAAISYFDLNFFETCVSPFLCAQGEALSELLSWWHSASHALRLPCWL